MMRCMRCLARKEDGFITIFLLVITLIVMLSLITMVVGVALGAYKLAWATYMWFGEAANFSAANANMMGTMDNAPVRFQEAETKFILAFTQMTNTTFTGNQFAPGPGSPYPGPITLDSFTAVNPGDPIPYGTARQPGFMAAITVPVWGKSLPFIGPQYVTVPMRYFAPVKSTQLMR
ncbi:hypothetical protein SDD30_14150 [Moorella naiadis]|uniref:hypothetical protein n=1 Tax=Moorella naiadis (nom. illeg.) TaxID=3093670 RepID=UPI003D9CA20F